MLILIMKKGCGSQYTAAFPVTSGLKQGCILSPLLFNLVMEKVARSITTRPEGVTFNNLRVNCLGYADDIDVIGANLREVESLATHFKTMACQVGLEINEGKTKIMEVTRTPQLRGNINLAGIRVEAVESFKYLGTVMSQSAGMTGEVTARIGAANRCYFSLTDLFKRRSISRKTK